MNCSMVKGVPLKDYKNEYNHKYYPLHKQEVIANMLTPVKCECGFECGKSNLKRHQKSKLHLKKMNTLEEFS